MNIKETEFNEILDELLNSLEYAQAKYRAGREEKPERKPTGNWLHVVFTGSEA